MAAEGSYTHLGAGCRRFESCHSDHVAADGISFAATFLQKSPLIHSVAAPFQIEPAALGFDLVFFSKGLSPIITRGPNTDNPNCMIQVGNVFGFIFSIENTL